MTTGKLWSAKSISATPRRSRTRRICIAFKTLVNGGTSMCSDTDLATTVMFENDPLVSGSTPIMSTHIGKLRTALDEAMDSLGLTTGGYTTASLANTPVLAVQFQEIRNRVK